jgi:6-phosphofructokinase 1
MAIGEDLFDVTPLVLEHLEQLGIGCLVAIGGDDTLSYAARLHREGVPLLAIPKTMDNDVPGTEYCIGFSTAVTRAKELINRQRTTLGSHERFGVFRIFGRDAGFTALYTAFVTSARCLIPEATFELEQLVALLVEDRTGNPSGYAFVIAAEGARWAGGTLDELGPADAFGHRHKANVAEVLASEIRELTGVETVASELTYDLRSGEPDSLDQLVAITFANVAMDALRDGRTGRMSAVREGRYALAPLPGPDEHARRVDVPTMYNEERLRPRYDGLLGRPMLLGVPVGR